MTVGMTWPQFRRNECTVDGRLVQLYPAQAALVATFLVSHPDHWVDCDTIVEALWPDPWRQPDSADVVVRVYISRLRKLGLAVESKFYRGKGAIAKFNGWRIPRAARGEAERLAA